MVHHQTAALLPSKVPQGQDFADLFSSAVSRDPHRLALRIGNQELSFNDLEGRCAQQVGQMEALFANSGGNHLPLLVDFSLDSHVAVFTCLLFSIPFALVDGRSPAGRVSKVLELLENPSLGWAGPDVDPGCVPENWSQKRSPSSQERPTKPPTLVITTSGSTGTPKGVEISHHSHFERLFLDAEEVEMSPCDIATFAPLHFVGGLNRLSKVALGNTVHVINPFTVSVRQIAAYIAEHQINILSIPPQLARILSSYNNPDNVSWGSVRLIRCSSESIRYETLHGLKKYCSPGVLVRHGLGATEGLGAFFHQFPLEKAPQSGIVPVGAATERVLLVPAEALGAHAYEVLVTGPIALGYLSQPTLTSERFVTIEGRRYWRSGDYVRETSPDLFIHIGRVDDIVKVRGMLASPSETTNEIMKLSGIKLAVTLPHRSQGNTRLVSFVEKVEGIEVDMPAMRAALQKTLPAHLLPQEIVVYDQIPTNARGKIDRDFLMSSYEDRIRKVRP